MLSGLDSFEVCNKRPVQHGCGNGGQAGRAPGCTRLQLLICQQEPHRHAGVQHLRQPGEALAHGLQRMWGAPVGRAMQPAAAGQTRLVVVKVSRRQHPQIVQPRTSAHADSTTRVRAQGAVWRGTGSSSPHQVVWQSSIVVAHGTRVAQPACAVAARHQRTRLFILQGSAGPGGGARSGQGRGAGTGYRWLSEPRRNARKSRACTLT